MKKVSSDVALHTIIRDATNAGWQSGSAGALAMSCQIATLMWLHTAMTFQYKFGGEGVLKTLKYLRQNGGYKRLYFGVGPALVQGTLGRFGDTAASSFSLSFFEQAGWSRVPLFIQTSFASAGAGFWRICLMPLNTWQTMRQVEGHNGLNVLKNKVEKHGFRVLFHGATGEYVTTFGGHLFWFGTYNTLCAHIPKPESKKAQVLRNGGMGVVAALVTDCFTNWVRVIKTYRQSHKEPIAYLACIREISQTDGGMKYLFVRGLKTRMCFSCMQGFIFSILWNIFQDKMHPPRTEKSS